MATNNCNNKTFPSLNVAAAVKESATVVFPESLQHRNLARQVARCGAEGMTSYLLQVIIQL